MARMSWVMRRGRFRLSMVAGGVPWVLEWWLAVCGMWGM